MEKKDNKQAGGITREANRTPFIMMVPKSQIKKRKQDTRHHQVKKKKIQRMAISVRTIVEGTNENCNV